MQIPPRVLLIVENCPAPEDRRVWHEARTLRDQGYQVCIISPKGDDAYTESYACVEGIHIYRYATRTGSSLASYIAEYVEAFVRITLLSVKVLRRHGFDVLHVANPPDFFFLLAWMYRPLGKQFVFDQHDLASELLLTHFPARQSSPLVRFIYHTHRLMEWLSYRSAQLVITANRTFSQRAISRGVRPERVVVVRNGPSIDFRKPVEVDPALKHGWKYMLAYLGVMAIQDGVDYALYALHHLVHERGRKDVGLVLMGKGSELDTLRALARELGLEEHVHFTGWISRPELQRYLAAADIGLSPDPQNGVNEHSTMIKVLEYMAMAKPVVAFDLAETRESAGAAGLYATPNEVNDLAAKIEQVLDDDELRLRMGTLGRERILTQLSWEHSAGRLAAAYRALCGWPRDPKPRTSSELRARSHAPAIRS